jgi:hypothetical protein
MDKKKEQNFKRLNVQESDLYDICHNLEDINIEEGDMYICRRSIEIRGGTFTNGTIENAIINGGTYTDVVFINCVFIKELTEEQKEANRFIKISA